MRILLDDEVHVDYGQIDVESHGDDDDGRQAARHDSFAGQQVGPCGAAVPGRLSLRTALHTGCVFFTVELHEAEPPLDADR